MWIALMFSIPVIIGIGIIVVMRKILLTWIYQCCRYDPYLDSNHPYFQDNNRTSSKIFVDIYGDGGYVSSSFDDIDDALKKRHDDRDLTSILDTIAKKKPTPLQMENSSPNTKTEQADEAPITETSSPHPAAQPHFTSFLNSLPHDKFSLMEQPTSPIISL